MTSYKYKIGDTIKINKNYKDYLKETEYKVVGTIFSPLYTSNEYGNTTIGNGKIYSFVFIPKENFFVLTTGLLDLPWMLEEDMDEVISTANEPEYMERMMNRLLANADYGTIIS